MHTQSNTTQLYKDLFNDSIQNPEQFWLNEAKNLPWFTPPTQGLTTDENGFYRWFPNAATNTCYLAVDRHIEAGLGTKNAFIYDSPVTNTIKHFTYNQLHAEVSKLAAYLQSIGLKKGDTAIIYMPMIPEAIFSMLACARIGVIHSVVFGGFAAHELAIRIDDAKPKVILTASCGIEISRVIPYKPIVDHAIEEATHKIEKVIVKQREQHIAEIDSDTYIAYVDAVHPYENTTVDCVEVAATDPLYILYTSGTTGKPKGIIRDNGGHAVALNFSMQYVYGAQKDDVFWAASDVGWVVGHSYIVYGPLIYGCTTILFEGKPIKTPDASTFWRVIAEHKVNIMFTAPTAIRAIRKEDPNGDFIKNYDLLHFRTQFLAGERCDVATLGWTQEQLQVPVIDHWWQTESGWPMLANMAGLELAPVKPGSATFPVPGFNLKVVDHHGNECAPNNEGLVVIKLPLPPGCLPTLWGDNERFKKGYLSTVEGYYFSGDGGYKDKDGYVYITGRVDDIINVAGHRLSTAEMEEVVASHPQIAECAVVGRADELKGQVPTALIVLKNKDAHYETVKAELVQMVRDTIGAVASFKEVHHVERLPKTRSGKTLRKIIRAIIDGDDYKMPSTIEDPTVLKELHEYFNAL